MTTIFKYPVEVTDVFTMDLPKGAVVLSVQCQGEAPQLWARVDPSAPLEPRTFRVFGTGHPVADDLSLEFVGTFQMLGGSLVFHLFEETT